MTNLKTRMLPLLAFGALLCAPAGVTLAADSGFLPDYSRLQSVKTDQGTDLRRWVSPNFNGQNYHAILVDNVTFYPDASASTQVSNQTLADILSYASNSLRTVALGSVPQVTVPGPGVARLHMAITAVDTSNSGLKPWQIIPVALVFNAAEAASGHRTMNVDLNIEALLSDSVTGEVLGEMVRKAKGVTVPNAKTQLTLDTVKDRMDQWSIHAAEFVNAKMKKQ